MTLRLEPARERRHYADAAEVARLVTPQDPVSPDEIQHGLASNPDSLLVVAYLDGVLAGSGFAARSSVADAAYAMARVLREQRNRGVGRALYTALSEHARALEKQAVWGRVREEDEASLAVVHGWGFEQVGHECEVVLELAGARPAGRLPEGVEIVSLAERPDLVRAAYEVEREAVHDMPAAGPVAPWTFERWQAAYLEGPSALPGGCFVAVTGGEVVGIAGLTALDAQPGSAEHLLTGVRRAWRGRGIATALKRVQIEWARDAGLERLVTSNDETNLPMRGINARLGYEPRPGAIVVRGPLAPS